MLEAKVTPLFSKCMFNNNAENLIITIGDSWTFGAGPVKRKNFLGVNSYIEYILETNKHNYQHFLIDKLDNYDLLNLGKEGGSNEVAVESLIHNLNLIKKYKNKILIFGLTDLSRSFIMFDKIIPPVDILSIKDPTLLKNMCIGDYFDIEEFIKYYILVADNEKNNYFKFLSVLYKLNLICEKNSIKLVMFSVFPEQHKKKINYIEDIFTEYKDLTTEIKKFGFAEDSINYLITSGKLFNGDPDYFMMPCYHPNKEGYKLMSDVIFKMIEGFL